MIVGLFTEEEINLAKKEYDFKDRCKDSSVSETSSIFTEYNLNTSTSNDRDDISKSDILAPFNTNEEDDKSFIGSIEPLVVSRKVIKFASHIREVNRQYERDNNSNNDDGIYVQPVNPGASPRIYTTRSTTANTTQSSSNKINKQLLMKMEKMGLEKSFVIASLCSNIHNCATTCYYLLMEE